LEGGYYFSPADLELIELVPELADAGVNSFKIEGRMKSAEYVGTVVSAYRRVIDSLDGGENELRKAIAEAQLMLKNDFARSKTMYLINEKPARNGVSNNRMDWLNPAQNGGTGIPMGRLLRVKGGEGECKGLIPTGMIAPSVGDSVRLHRSDDSERVSHKISSVEKDKDDTFWISIPDGFSPGDAVYLIQTKAMTKRYAQVIPRSTDGKHRSPGREKAPYNVEPLAKTKKADLPGGIYAMVSRTEDLYVLQSSRPVKAILPFNRKNVKRLLDAQPLPFPARDIIISLDPFFPQAKNSELEEGIPALIKKGYAHYIANNLGHFSLFRAVPNELKLLLIAGPWLYAFNAWARDFIFRCGAEYLVSPLENSRQNLEKTFPLEKSAREKKQPERSGVFVTIFSRPAIFHIRSNLGAYYDFENFGSSAGSAKQGHEFFSIASGPEGSVVYPLEPFSIVDKIPFLKEAGFSRFIMDFSGRPLKKADYRDIMEAVKQGLPLPGVSRFNWKNGFYREPQG
jgi:putative protease